MLYNYCCILKQNILKKVKQYQTDLNTSYVYESDSIFPNSYTPKNFNNAIILHFLSY